MAKDISLSMLEDTALISKNNLLLIEEANDKIKCMEQRINCLNNCNPHNLLTREEIYETILSPYMMTINMVQSYIDEWKENFEKKELISHISPQLAEYNLQFRTQIEYMYRELAQKTILHAEKLQETCKIAFSVSISDLLAWANLYSYDNLYEYLSTMEYYEKKFQEEIQRSITILHEVEQIIFP